MKRVLPFLIVHCAFSIVNCLYAQTPGNLDTSFDPGTGANGLVMSVVLQPDGKILIGGYFTEYNGTPRNRIARLNADGSLDTSFDPGTGVTGRVTGSGPSTEIQVMFLQPDGKILIGGHFTEYNGTSRNLIARLHADGSLDTSFDPGTGALANPGGGYVRSIALQSDGKILIGGIFTEFNGIQQKHLARLNTDGTLDTTFDIGTGSNYGLYGNTLSFQSDGKIIFAGGFSQYNGVTQKSIARLNTDGRLDTGFDSGTGTENLILCMFVQPDDKILIGGYFYSYNNTLRKCIARLNADGSLDTTFDPGTGMESGEVSVTAVALAPDGKILVGGNFSSYNGASANYIARLHSDGSLDTSFEPGTGTGYYKNIYSFAQQPDGKILIGGAFTEYNGTGRNYIARLHGTPTTGTPEPAVPNNIRVYPNPAHAMLNLQLGTLPNPAVVELYDMSGRVVKAFSLKALQATIPIAELPRGVYLVKVSGDKGFGTARFHKE